MVHIFKLSSPGCYFLTIVSFTVILLRGGGGGGGDSQPLHIGCLVKKSKRSNLCILSYTYYPIVLSSLFPIGPFYFVCFVF